MKILVSACLLGENCKYNGGNNLNNKLLKLIKGHEVVSVCPEVLGGLSTPRLSSEIVDGVVKNIEGDLVDYEFRLGAKRALDIALNEKIDFAILQSRSPSCGVKQIYDGTFSKNLISGKGIFASELTSHGIKVIDIEDI